VIRRITQKTKMKSNLKKAVALLANYSNLSNTEQRKRIRTLQQLIKEATKREQEALLISREIDQLRKEHAYLHMQSGDVNGGIKEIESIVTGYEQSILRLHEEAAFQLAEAANAAFDSGDYSRGEKFARSALSHSGACRQISRIVMEAFECLQKNQELRSKAKSRT
jgi:hypothetical protein